MSLAPIGIITYSRIAHLKKTIESLKDNEIAKKSILYIFLDAPKVGDEEKVAKVRSYIYTINGFEKINIIERKTNNIVQNGILGMQQLFDEYGKCIFMEDDNVVSSHFLQFMNDGLNFYKDDKSIMAISGYNIPIKYQHNNENSYYLSVYFNGWGFGMWADRDYLNIVNSNNQYNEIILNHNLHRKVKKIHPKLVHKLKLIKDNKLNAGDYKLVFHMIKNDLYVVRPIKSFVNNIGHDGSGVHCIANDSFQNNLLNNKKIDFFKGIEYNEEIDKQYYSFFHPKITVYTLLQKLKNRYF